MNLVLLHESDFKSSNNILIDDHRLVHIKNIHKAKKGDTLKVGLVNDKIGIGTIENINSHSLEMSVELTKTPPPKLPLTLLIALPRPQTVKKVLQCATTMGVKHIVFFKTWRVEKNYWQSPVLYEESILANCNLGLEQACDTILPIVECKHYFKPFIENELPAISKNSLKLVSHPIANSKLPRNVTGNHITLAIGPEGGFTSHEIESFEKNGFETVTLGERILRVEQAIPAILGRLF